MKSVTCVVHQGEVDDSDTILLPAGPVCTRCYEWMESLMEEAEEVEVEYIDDDEDDEDDDGIL